MSGSFLFFVNQANEGRKTERVLVHSARHGEVLGGISWYGAWRQYVFEAAEGTVWSDGCLADLRAKLAEMNKAQRGKQARARVITDRITITEPAFAYRAAPAQPQAPG